MTDPQAMFIARRPVEARWVAVMTHRRDERRLQPAGWRTRCLQAGEVHEVLTCADSEPGVPIDNVGYLGFAEITSPGVVALGDVLIVNARAFGTVLGFDETHMPNHYNIVIASPDGPATGAEHGLGIDQPLTFRPPRQPQR